MCALLSSINENNKNEPTTVANDSDGTSSSDLEYFDIVCILNEYKPHFIEDLKSGIEKVMNDRDWLMENAI